MFHIGSEILEAGPSQYAPSQNSFTHPDTFFLIILYSEELRKQQPGISPIDLGQSFNPMFLVLKTYL